MLEVSDVAQKIENILNTNDEGTIFKIFTDTGEMEADMTAKVGTEKYVCGLLELFGNTLSGEGLKFQQVTFQITWFVDGKKTRTNGKKMAVQVEAVRRVLTQFANAYNNKNMPTENFNDDIYSTTYFVKMPTNQTEIKNFGYMVSCVPMTQIIEMLMIVNGFSSNQWIIKANDEKLVYQSITISNEKQANHNLIADEKRTKGIILSSGVCFDMVIQQLTTDFCDLVEKDVLDYNKDYAICVYAKGHKTANVYICTLGSDAVSMQIGVNAGMNVALVEGVEDLLYYDEHWSIKEITTTEENEVVEIDATGHVFWGDGNKTIGANDKVQHTFADPGTYTIRVFGTIKPSEEETE